MQTAFGPIAAAGSAARARAVMRTLLQELLGLNVGEVDIAMYA